MTNSDVHFLDTDDLDVSRFAALLEQHHIDIVVDAGQGGAGEFAPAPLAELCAAQGFGYLPRGDQLDPTRTGAEAFEVSVGAIAELARTGRVLVLNPHDRLAGVLERFDLVVVELAADGLAGPYQDHLDLD